MLSLLFRMKKKCNIKWANNFVISRENKEEPLKKFAFMNCRSKAMDKLGSI